MTSTTTQKNTRNKIGVISLGGAAIKILNVIRGINTDPTVTPELVPLYVDTSLTEVNYVLPHNEINVIKTDSGETGSGGDRSAN